jgi:N-acetylmuramoyl-L-alanine amidase
MLLGALGLICCAATIARAETIQTQSPAQTTVTAVTFPVATDVRLAGDAKQTRFILDLDRKIDLRAFALANPYRVVLDIPQVTFNLTPGIGTQGRGLIKAFRYGLVMPGGSRIVFDLSGPAKIEKSYVLDAENGQPARLVVELAAVDRAAFAAASAEASSIRAPAAQSSSSQAAPDMSEIATAKLRAAIIADASASANLAGAAPKSDDTRPLIVLDPGHGGIDNGAQTTSGESEKTLVLDFAQALRERLEKSGKYRVVLTRSDDTFIPLADRVEIARRERAALFVSIHADSLPKNEGDAQGATIYTLSDRASDDEAAKLAETENKADAIAGINLTEEPTDVADILIDLTQRETRAFSSRFARTLAGEMKHVARMHKNPLKSAGFRVLKAHDVPSVLIELGYVSNEDDLHNLLSDGWRSKTVGSVAQAIDMFFGKKVVSAGPAN